MFTQSSKNTVVDSRRAASQHDKGYRSVPFKLPILIEEKLSKFMATVGLNFGVIDMIYTKENEYIFLEINPNGQFEFLEEKCNYYISKNICRYLIKHK